MRKVFITINEKRFEVELLSRNEQTMTFTCNGETYQVSAEPSVGPAPLAAQAPSHPAASLSRSTAVAAAPSIDTNQVTAPMPGIVVAVQVKKGASVAAGETVAVIEAMKMENNIRSPRDGTVAEVLISPGSEVATGQPLIKLL